MYTKNKNDTFSWKNRPSKMVYDPMMYVLSEYVQDEAKKKKLIENKDGLKIALENMFRNSVSDFNGRNNNKSDVIRRIELFRLIFNDILGI